MARRSRKPPVVIKHSAAVHIRGPIGFAERKVWTALLQHAYGDLVGADEHQIQAAELVDRTGLNTNNWDYLKGLLINLAEISVVWDGMSRAKEGETWGVMSMLGAAHISAGTVTYEFPKALRKKLAAPSVYTKYFLEQMLSFRSRYAYALFECCTDYTWNRKDLRYGVVETPYIPLDVFRANFGVPKGSYPRTADLRRAVIDPAVREVNEVSNLEIEVVFRRRGRSYDALKFTGHRVSGKGPQLSMMLL